MAHTSTGTEALRRFAPADCPHCEYDRQFPGFEAGGWVRQENNGPIVRCPMCNDDGTKVSRPLAKRCIDALNSGTVTSATSPAVTSTDGASAEQEGVLNYGLL